MTDTVIVTREQVLEALRDVYDPEIPINVVDLGLIYDCQVTDGIVNIKMTLTFAGCAMGPFIAHQAELRIKEIPGVKDAHVELVFEPPWNPDRISDEGKEILGIG